MGWNVMSGVYISPRFVGTLVHRKGFCFDHGNRLDKKLVSSGAVHETLQLSIFYISEV